MARMYSKRRGISKSSIPYSRSPAHWVKLTPEEVSDLVASLATQGLTESQIGVQLRDQHGIPSTKTFMGKKITQIMHEKNVTPESPDYIAFLKRRVHTITKHLETNPNDKVLKFNLDRLKSK